MNVFWFDPVFIISLIIKKMKNNTKSGFKRSHTEIFLSMRASIHGYKGPRADNSDNILINKAQDMNSKLSFLERKIGELESLFVQRSKPTFDSNAIELIDHDIKSLTTDISSKITAIKGEIKSSIRSMGNEEVKLLFNLQQSHSMRLTANVQRFRAIQATSRPEMHINDEKDDPISTLYADFEANLNHDQMALLHRNEEEMRAQNNEITRLIQMMNELNDLFRDVSLLVFEQGSILDRIDTKIQVAVKEVEDGNKQLEKANKNDESSCYYYYLGVVLFLIVLCLVIVLLKK